MITHSGARPSAGSGYCGRVSEVWLETRVSRIAVSSVPMSVNNRVIFIAIAVPLFAAPHGSSPQDAQDQKAFHWLNKG